MNHNGHTNSTVLETTSLTLISEPLGMPKVFSVGGSQPFGRSGVHLDNTAINPPIIHSDQDVT